MKGELMHMKGITANEAGAVDGAGSVGRKFVTIKGGKGQGWIPTAPVVHMHKAADVSTGSHWLVRAYAYLLQPAANLLSCMDGCPSRTACFRIRKL